MKVNCKICGSSRLKQINTSALPMVFSDGKKAPLIPCIYKCENCNTFMKEITEEWKSNVDMNYRDQYTPSTNSDIVKPGAHLNRINHVVANLDLEKAKDLNILDYGMGNGDLSKYLIQTFSSVSVDGFDPYVHELGSLLYGTDKFRFYSEESELFSSSTLYDYIILLQSLEHIDCPQAVIAKLQSKLKAHGSIFIQIPSPYLNPVDIVVYDHVFHFSNSYLDNTPDSKLLAGMPFYVQVSNHKEILIELSHSLNIQSSERQAISTYPNPIDTLHRFLDKCRDICMSSDVVIFGKSYSSQWLSYALDQKYELVTSTDFEANNLLKNKYVLLPFPRNQALRLSRLLGFNNFFSF